MGQKGQKGYNSTKGEKGQKGQKKGEDNSTKGQKGDDNLFKGIERTLLVVQVQMVIKVKKEKIGGAGTSSVPSSGVIVAWSGTVSHIPSGWFM